MWKHPLLKYIEKVKKWYAVTKQDAIVLDALGSFWDVSDYNFNHWLEFLAEYNEEAQNEDIKLCLEVFRPLDITVYNHYALFHYKGFIDLSEMGYSESEFFYLYDGLYQECRSCVFDLKSMELVLCSIPKFKNYSEDDKLWSEKSIRDNYKKAAKIWITDKMDGSYQQFRYLKDKGEIVGSGSSALDIKESWRLAEGYKLLSTCERAMIKEYPNYTFIFEFISTKNPIVVHYEKKQEGMYLITARNNLTGKEMDFDKLRDIAKSYNSPMVEYYDSETIDSVLTQVDDFSSDEKEGWVVRMQDEKGNNFRTKVKCADYCNFHRVISKNVSPNAVIQAVANDKYDDFYSKVPDAYKDIVSKYYKEVLEYLIARTTAYVEWIFRMRDEIGIDGFLNDVSLKEKMVWITNNAPECVRSDMRNDIRGVEKGNFLIRRGYPYHRSEIIELTKQYNKAINDLKNKYNKEKEE